MGHTERIVFLFGIRSCEQNDTDSRGNQKMVEQKNDRGGNDLAWMRVLHGGLPGLWNAPQKQDSKCCIKEERKQQKQRKSGQGQACQQCIECGTAALDQWVVCGNSGLAVAAVPAQNQIPDDRDLFPQREPMSADGTDAILCDESFLLT